MNRDGDKGKLFLKRAEKLFVIQLILLFVLIARMYYLQVIEADKYMMLAESNRVSMRMLLPQRGLIFDRNGVPIALNNQNFRVMVVPEQTDGNIKASLDALGKLIPLTEDDYSHVNKELKRKRAFVPIGITDNLSWEDMAKIQLNSPDLPGIIIEEGRSRYYPYGYDTAHIVGYVGLVTEKDLTGEPLLELPGFRLGKTGVEATYDLDLRGIGGSRRIEVNVVGREIRELELTKAIAGKPLELTLDIRVQQKAMEALKNQSGAVVVVDVNTGEIIALASAPSFDANIFSLGVSSKDWQELSKDIKNPLMNKAIAGEYSPGSTFKMIVALAALEAGIITPTTEIYCGAHMELGSHRFHCWKQDGHDYINLREALAESCDIYFYEIARMVGIDKIAEMAKRFGLGVKQGIDMPNEKDGLVPTQEWKLREFSQHWQLGETMLTGIGQSYITATPLQLAMMTARIANGGKMLKPHLLKQSTSSEAKNIKISKYFLEVVKEGMFDVLNTTHGTAYYSRISDSLGLMAGKTGTTQVRRISMKERETGVLSQEELNWKERNHALFVGYAPVKNPRYAIAVLVEHGGGGASAAAPIAKEVMTELLILDKKDASLKKKQEDEKIKVKK